MGLHEECGVFGIYDFDKSNVVPYVVFGLVALQHRGQESCGIAASRNLEVQYHKDLGLVADVFTPTQAKTLDGHMAIGHVRYSTTGSSVRENAQPLVMNYKKGTLSIAHNGNLSNADELRAYFQDKGAVFQTTTDSEIIAYSIARERLNCSSVEEAVCRALPFLQGSYSLLVMSPRKLIAARDPHGFRSLCIGKLDNSYVFASESCALDAVGADFVRDILPGEVVTVTDDGITTVKQFAAEPAKCIFEYIYFARPDSVIDGVSVLKAREIAGKLLAQQHPVDADLVIGVPESGIDAAVGFSKESGIPYGRGFIKNSYVGRTFIKPVQSDRDIGVMLKINPLKENVTGKRIVMIDDSIVRGTTCAKIVKALKSAGAKEVHMRVASPKFLWPCYFGTDIPNRDNLAAVNYETTEEIRDMIGADSLGYLSLDSLHELIGSDEYCNGCFSGTYPVEVNR
ncbi:MAG: amidophosphoribosyltransferase [Clostridiales bacterium 43-6]|nr:MAG: amidophosphoribosyltransferase [Clostridiales bacterium 43-6]